MKSKRRLLFLLLLVLLIVFLLENHEPKSNEFITFVEDKSVIEDEALTEKNFSRESNSYVEDPLGETSSYLEEDTSHKNGSYSEKVASLEDDFGTEEGASLDTNIDTEEVSSSGSDFDTEEGASLVTDSDIEEASSLENDFVTEETSYPDTQNSVLLSVSCQSVFAHADLAKGNAWDVIPADGIILKQTKVSFEEGETAFDVLKRELKNRGIHMEFNYTPVYKSYYIEGIANLYEFDFGELSGWIYKVNGIAPNVASSSYVLKTGDTLEFVYSCELGNDV